MDVVVQLIQSLGVPVAAMVAMGWYVISKDKSHRSERDEWRKDEQAQRDKENESLEKLIDSVNENTVSLKILAEKIVSNQKEV